MKNLEYESGSDYEKDFDEIDDEQGVSVIRNQNTGEKVLEPRMSTVDPPVLEQRQSIERVRESIEQAKSRISRVSKQLSMQSTSIVKQQSSMEHGSVDRANSKLSANFKHQQEQKSVRYQSIMLSKESTLQSKKLTSSTGRLSTITPISKTTKTDQTA